jgi:uncharacterized protein YeaO (DUF488 family)
MADRSVHERFELHRIYEDEGSPDGSHGDGYRVLVDRLWPRGVRKADAALDEWAKDVAPSAELRKWYGHEPDRFEEFARRYHDELEHHPAADAVAHLHDLARQHPVTLLTATRDIDRSGARVLHDHLRGRPTSAP